MTCKFSPDDRRRIATLAGIHPHMLYMSLTRRASFSPQECVRIEEVTNKEVRRWDLRPKDWWLIWPELRNRKGAPDIPGSKPAGADHAGPQEMAQAAAQ